MAEAPPTEPTSLAVSRLPLAPLVSPPSVEPWVPPLALLALQVDQSTSTAPAGLDAEARAYLRALADATHRLSYVSVDELVGTVAGLALDPWPGVDDRGRLVFGDEERVGTLDVDLELLQRFVAAHRQWSADRGLYPTDMMDEPVRIGDVFGAVVTFTTDGRRRAIAWLDEDTALPTLHVRAEHLPRTVVALSGLTFDDTGGSIVDLACDARELAKTAYYAAMAAELNVGLRADQPVVRAASIAALERLGEAVLERGDGGT